MTDIRIDLYPCRCTPPVIWGNVYDECGNPMAGSPIQLVYCPEDGLSGRQVVCRTNSDCCGRYEIQMPCCCRGSYQIEVGCSRPPRERRCHRQNNICYY